MFDQNDIQLMRVIWIGVALIYWLAWEWEFHTEPNPGKTRLQIFLVGLLWPVIIGVVLTYWTSKFLLEMIINQRCD